ncbi:hypothetical protein COI_1738 [Mannheimia haemolytica serotype A2 str. OVINE]|nr:hypothetical protein COI_1738 [Mannheimia haemolytica serotype A2 str. OVINE]
MTAEITLINLNFSLKHFQMRAMLIDKQPQAMEVIRRRVFVYIDQLRCCSGCYPCNKLLNEFVLFVLT